MDNSKLWTIIVLWIKFQICVFHHLVNLIYFSCCLYVRHVHSLDLIKRFFYNDRCLLTHIKIYRTWSGWFNPSKKSNLLLFLATRSMTEWLPNVTSFQENIFCVGYIFLKNLMESKLWNYENWVTSDRHWTMRWSK